MKRKDEKGSVKKRKLLRSLRTENIRNKKSNLPKRPRHITPLPKGRGEPPKGGEGEGL